MTAAGPRELLDQLDQAHAAAALLAEHNALPGLTAALRAVLDLADELEGAWRSERADAKAEDARGDYEQANYWAGRADADRDAMASLRAMTTAALTGEGTTP